MDELEELKRRLTRTRLINLLLAVMLLVVMGLSVAQGNYYVRKSHERLTQAQGMERRADELEGRANELEGRVNHLVGLLDQMKKSCNPMVSWSKHEIQVGD